jgi:transcriptional regulator
MITNAFGVAVPAPNHSQLLERITMFTDEEIENIIALRTKGWTLVKVAELFNTDRLTVRKIESKYYRLKREKENA